MYYLYNRPMGYSVDWIRSKFAAKPELARANELALRAGLAYCEATEVFQDTYDVPRAQLEPGTYRNISGNHALALGFVAASAEERASAVPGLVPDHARVRHPPRPVRVQELRRRHVPGGGRDRRHRRRDRRLVRGRARDHDDQRARARAQERVHRARRHGGASARDRGHPARRPLDGAPDEDRAGRPPAGPVRAPLRGTVHRDGRAVPLRLLRVRLRGEPPHDPAHDAGDPPLRRVHRQRSRAVEAARRSPTCPGFRCASTRSPKGSSPTCGTRRPWPARGRSPERRDSSIASAASRKPRTRATSRYDALNHEAMVKLRAEKVARVADDIPDRGRPSAMPTAACSSSRGARPTAPSRARYDTRAREGRRVSHLHLRHLNPMPSQLGGRPGPLRRDPRPGDEHWASWRSCSRGGSCGRSSRSTKVQGQPFKEAEILDKIHEMTEVH